MGHIRILGTGSYVPPKILSNVDLEKLGLDTTDEWIEKRTGVKERRIADQDVNTSDLAYEASMKALLEGPLTAQVTSHPAFSEFSVKPFDVMEEVTATTRGPVK